MLEIGIWYGTDDRMFLYNAVRKVAGSPCAWPNPEERNVIAQKIWSYAFNKSQLLPCLIARSAMVAPKSAAAARAGLAAGEITMSARFSNLAQCFEASKPTKFRTHLFLQTPLNPRGIWPNPGGLASTSKTLLVASSGAPSRAGRESAGRAAWPRSWYRGRPSSAAASPRSDPGPRIRDGKKTAGPAAMGGRLGEA